MRTVGLWTWPYSPLGWSGPEGTLSLGPRVPATLAAGPSSKEMLGSAAGNVPGAALKPVAVLLPTGLNVSEEQTFFRAFLNTYHKGTVELRNGGAGGKESN